MTTLSPTELARLNRFISAHKDRFALALVRIPNFHQRKEFAAWIEKWAEEFAVEQRRPVGLFDFTAKTPLQVWSELEKGLPPGAIAVLDGLDLALNDSHAELASLLNRQRERIAQLLPGPVLLVLGDSAMNRFFSDAPDLADWYAARFEFEEEPSLNVPRESETSSKIPELSSEFIDSRIALLNQQLLSAMHDQSRARILMEIAQLHRDSVYSVRTDADHPRIRTAQDSLRAAEDALAEAIKLLRRPSNRSLQAILSEALDELAGLLQDEGRFRDAEPLYLEALATRAAFLGEEHPDTLSSLNNLAELYDRQGRYAEAEPMYRRSLETREKVLGPEHRDTLTSLNDLAGLYESQRRYAEAEPMYRRSLETRERVLGPEHRETLTSLNDLAFLYKHQGRYAEAEPMYRRALETFERFFGPEHPDTLTSSNNLASLYESQGRYAEAEPMYRRALETREKVLGLEHPDTLTSLNNLAGLYDSQRRYGDAEPLYARAVAGLEKTLGLRHPNTITGAHNYAQLLRKLNRHQEARALEARFPRVAPISVE